ncbi:hypothetical protein H2198_007693 [Neophaeococcomyces mojaviensis]|uniref:Uncharacterized protein n=1 Tax=Neophaeococcomyces mojaviensis TaxID=3383035 RepID=A0ACC2ZZC4_9EURO|nr:hypothetical protein H2198_007693 [Knufia sp. JES_112]
MAAEALTYDAVTLPPPVVDTNLIAQKSTSQSKIIDDTRDTTDPDTDEDGDDFLSPDLSAEGDADSVVAVSISHVQNQMKSPITPAATKAQVLESSKSYFTAEADIQDQFSDEPLQESFSTGSPLIKAQQWTRSRIQNNSSLQPLSLWQAPLTQDKQTKRSSLVGSILGTANSNRQRSSSGSSLFDNIKKRLPELPSLSLPRWTGPNDERQRSQTINSISPFFRGLADERDASRIEYGRPHERPAPQLPAVKTEPAHSTYDGSNDAKQKQDDSMPNKLRRSTSDQSLYLRRAATGASEFDDYNAFANVSEMVNSRFKAITDSLQDSSLKIPKMPSISFGSNRPTSSRSISEDTRNNTKMNTGPLAATLEINGYRDKVNVTHAREKQHPILSHALSRLHGDLVILGGYRGSILREAQPPNRQLWVPIKVGMNLRKADLEVGLTREDELRMEEKIIPDGTLSHIGPVDISRRLIKKCKKCRNVRDQKLRAHDYGYDWRLSPDLLSDRFIRFLESLPCNRPELPAEQRGAWIIAHSLGGLLTRHAINRRPELFAGVVYAGVPQNCVNILGPLRNGDDVLFSSRVLTAQVNFTLRTSYALLPQDGKCFVNKQTGERYDVDFFDVKTWEVYRLSPCIKAPLYRKQPEKRYSMMGSISETLSQRSSWFGSITSEPPISEGRPTSPKQQVKEKAKDAKQDLESAAETLEAKAEQPLSPTLSPNTQSSAHKPSVATQSTIPVPAATEYLSRTLNSVREFKEALTHNQRLQERDAYPPVSILFAKNTPTVYGAFVNSREDIQYDDAFDDLAFAAGDGVVLASAAQLPSGYRCVRGGRIESERGHVGLLGDLEGVGRCLGAILDARGRGVGLGAYQAEVETPTVEVNQAKPQEQAEE